ncbi:hypothetical protein S245_063670, partial [Arachis hypogaea]
KVQKMILTKNLRMISITSKSMTLNHPQIQMSSKLVFYPKIKISYLMLLRLLTILNKKKDFLLKLKKSLQKEKKPKNLVLSNKYDVKPIFKKLEKQVIRPITIQDLQSEVNNLKREIQEIRRHQDNHQLILSQLMQVGESGDELDQTECSKEQENKISDDNEGKEILRIIN